MPEYFIGGLGPGGRRLIAKPELVSRAVMEQDAMGRFISDVERGGDDLMKSLANRMQRRARAYAPRRTGKLRRSIKAAMLQNGREIRLVSKSPYAGHMEFGTRPHQISGVKANFDWDGGYFIWNNPMFGPIGSNRVRSTKYANWTYAEGATVRHPGTKPHFFMRRAWEETWREARTEMRKQYAR